jgi:hypothetical protein
MDQMSKKIASNDKNLENISTRMDTFASAIKNQYSFNKMIESQIAQLAAVVPPSDKGKILGQLADLETANLVDIHNATFYYTQPSEGRWMIIHSPTRKVIQGDLSFPPYLAFTSQFKILAEFLVGPKVVED